MKLTLILVYLSVIRDTTEIKLINLIKIYVKVQKKITKE